ncbi:MAG: histidinol-phosphate aminotransferase family protein [Chloroflexi bacterium]|nr:histidinol-phosphate aminotransferase family protein [Chloroflexota bacterium]
MTLPIHGGANIAELRSLGLRPEDVLDFSASINPLGAPSCISQAIGAVNLAAYPDTECTALRESLAARLAVSTAQILAGNGSTELIHLTARAYLNAGNRAVIFAPTFGEFAAACDMHGADVLSIVADEGNNFAWDIERAARIIAERAPSLVFLCNPNNPTGRYLSEADVRRIANSLPEDSLLMLDEAYLPFVEARWDSMPLLNLGNVALLRSMTKDYALTALRLGYMLAPPAVVERVRALQHSWSVNGLAQEAGIAALADTRHVEDGRAETRAAKRYLVSELDAIGLRCMPSAANFVLVKVGDARALRQALLTGHRISVRDCASFGLPEYIRIGVKTKADCERLIGALRDIFGGLMALTSHG